MIVMNVLEKLENFSVHSNTLAQQKSNHGGFSGYEKMLCRQPKRSTVLDLISKNQIVILIFNILNFKTKLNIHN